jgi:hypothetical protein
MWRVTAAFALIAMVGCASDTCPAKDEEAVSTCLQPMLAYASELQSQTGAMQFPVQGAHIFEHLCRLFKDFKVSAEAFTLYSILELQSSTDIRNTRI